MKRILTMLIALCPSAAFATNYTSGVASHIIDCSGTVTTGAASQQILAADPYRTYLSIQNPISATETLFVNYGAAASLTASSINLAPGGSVTFADNVIPSDFITVVATTTAHVFVCKRASTQ